MFLIAKVSSGLEIPVQPRNMIEQLANERTVLIAKEHIVSSGARERTVLTYSQGTY